MRAISAAVATLRGELKLEEDASRRHPPPTGGTVVPVPAAKQFTRAHQLSAHVVVAAVVTVSGSSCSLGAGEPHASSSLAAPTPADVSPVVPRASRSSTKSHPRPAATNTRFTGSGVTAASALAALPVKGRAPMTGYDRDQFGQAWLDTNRNGCDTRNDLLRRDLSELVVRPGTHGCLIERGTLADPYTATGIAFVRGDGDLVDIDHVAALGDDWATGAIAWDIRKRAALANDPMNLLAVDAGANRQKGDADAASWLPPNKAYRCQYVARQVAVKRKYGLWVTRPEKAAIARVLSFCAGQRLPPDSGAPVLAPVRVNAPDRTPTPAPTQAGSSVYYRNCDAARAAQAAPVHRGDPGYGSHLDRDGDGVACE